MTESSTIGPMLACAIGDAMGAGFEYVLPARVEALNDLSCYRQHPKWVKIRPGMYTDDTQMALGLAEHILEEGRWNTIALASRWLRGFCRDHRTGYAGGFYNLLCQAENERWAGVQLAARLEPTSQKNGGAMRAFPVGFLGDPAVVRDRAMLQASLTHATMVGMTAAAAAALAFHYAWYRQGPRGFLLEWLDEELPGHRFAEPWDRPVGANGINTVRAAVTAVVQGVDLANVLRRSVAFTGDVDTVAAIAMPIACAFDDLPQAFPHHLVANLENKPFGRDYLIEIDRKLQEKFPRPPPPSLPDDPDDSNSSLLDIFFGEDD